MLVKSILSSKDIKDIVTIGPDATLMTAAKLLSEHGIGTVLVSSDQKTPLGILSERDIVRQLSKVGPGCLDQTVETYMTRDLVTCVQDTSVEQALTQMTEGRFRHMPVVESGELVGIISLGDVVKAQLAEVAMEKSALEGMIMGH
ncbi:CBS domain-containing protein [Phaeobacter sp. HF9A]|uniref:CBS domain-containing protein n=1 Tax=Phaeobacter sp. HF9A TaxID=2721561 RepID=UPI001431C5B8|nr:CBS domain-containing protein [Phaeobacter sp. HF9A]NIZ13538.1 CBS domain-containing protein [Phaeobacter sp. HF9A]